MAQNLICQEKNFRKDYCSPGTCVLLGGTPAFKGSLVTRKRRGGAGLRCCSISGVSHTTPFSQEAQTGTHLVRKHSLQITDRLHCQPSALSERAKTKIRKTPKSDLRR